MYLADRQPAIPQVEPGKEEQVFICWHCEEELTKEEMRKHGCTKMIEEYEG